MYQATLTLERAQEFVDSALFTPAATPSHVAAHSGPETGCESLTFGLNQSIEPGLRYFLKIFCFSEMGSRADPFARPGEGGRAVGVSLADASSRGRGYALLTFNQLQQSSPRLFIFCIERCSIDPNPV